MPIVEREIRPNRPLDYVSGKIRFVGGGRGNDILFGWNSEGYPFATTDQRRVTPRGQVMGRNIRAVPLSFDVVVASFIPTAFEFAEIAKPLDRPDQGRQFTEDTMNLAVTDEIGAVKFIQVGELTLLDSILNAQVEVKIEGYKQYSLVIPDATSQKLNIILFSPGQEYSNDFLYRSFLLKVIGKLSEIDRNQNPPDQKGYVSVVKGAVRNLEEKGFGGEEAQGVDKLMVKLGVLEEAQTNGGARLTYLNVEQLRSIVAKFHEVVGGRFARGKI